MQVCTLLQTDNHTSIPPLSFLDRMPFLPPNQQRQSTEGTSNYFYQISTCQNILFVGVTEKVVKTFVTTTINNNNDNKEKRFV